MKANKYGVKVGDIFSASWGWEQTNVNFFQVIALCGEQSVRVREVHPEIIREDATGPMSGDYTYKVTEEVLPPVERSLFIKDQAKGDIKRLKCFDREGKYPCFAIASYADAHKVHGDTVTVYESWYA